MSSDGEKLRTISDDDLWLLHTHPSVNCLVLVRPNAMLWQWLCSSNPDFGICQRGSKNVLFKWKDAHSKQRTNLSSLHHIVWLLNSEVNFSFCLICKVHIIFCRYLDTGKTVFIWFSTAYGFRQPLGSLTCVPIKKGGTILSAYQQLEHFHTEIQKPLFWNSFPTSIFEGVFPVLFCVSLAP